jgi:hypothetical protein
MDPTPKVIANAAVQEFFKDSIDEALTNQKVEAQDLTIYYIVNLLTQFTHTEDFFEKTPEGLDTKPLALLFGQALAAQTSAERTQSLKRLGDVSLYIAGFFSNSLSRKLVDLDYYIAMGGRAYSSLSDMTGRLARGDTFTTIYEELSRKFTAFVDVLGEVSERAQVNSNKDILRLYDVWIRTRSKRAEEALAKLGIQPTEEIISPFEQ